MNYQLRYPGRRWQIPQRSVQDTVPAMMRPGEGVLVPEATQALGGARGINFLNRSAERGNLKVRMPTAALQRPPLPPPPRSAITSRQYFDQGGVAEPQMFQPQATIERYSLTGQMPDNREFSDDASLKSLAHPKTDLEYKLLQPGQLYIDPDDHKVYRKGYAQPTVI